MKLAKLETLMIKAIKQFNKEHKNCEIRTCLAYEGSSKGNLWSSALFGIKYFNKEAEQQEECEIGVGA